jgi:hypothetical protein
MKTLIYKELRENLKLAVPVFLLLSAFSIFAAWDGGGNALLSREFLRLFSLGCAGFAGALGWLQIHHERPRDLWAFLIHRPITRTKIFFAKIIGGLLIYFGTVSLPLLGYLIWISIPGHVSAPFEWGMALPGIGCVLLGLLWYFGAMLTSVREARWYASRGLGLAAALPLPAFALKAPGLLLFWQFELAIISVAAVLALAVWGSFQTDGGYRGQTLPGKAALAGVFALGMTVAVLLAIMFVAVALHRDSQSWYAVTKTGTVVHVTTRGNQPAVITDLNGARLKAPKAGVDMSLEELDHQLAPQYSASVDFRNPPTATYNLEMPRDFFYLPWREVDGIRWYWTRHGRLEGYESRTHRFVGSLGPSGLVKGNADSDEHFLRPKDAGGNYLAPRTLATSNRLYELDLWNRAAKPIFTVQAGDRIGGSRDVSDSSAIVVSKEFIQLVGDGKVAWQLPHDPRYLEPNYLTVFPLETVDQYILWIYSPRLQSKGAVEGKISRQMVRVSGHEIGPRVELEPPDPPRPGDERVDWALSAFVPPEFPFLKPLLLSRTISRVPIQWRLVQIAAVSAVICAVVGGFIGRRYHLPLRAQLGWALFHLLAGFPGFVAFLCVREWPAREACPACKKLRLVDREKCEHCGADFSPPEKTGTEVFAPLVADTN